MKKVIILTVILLTSIVGCSNKEDKKITVSVKDETTTVYERTLPVTVKKIYDTYFTALSNEDILTVETSSDKLSNLNEGDSISIKKYNVIKNDTIISYVYKY